MTEQVEIEPGLFDQPDPTEGTTAEFEEEDIFVDKDEGYDANYDYDHPEHVMDLEDQE